MIRYVSVLALLTLCAACAGPPPEVANDVAARVPPALTSCEIGTTFVQEKVRLIDAVFDAAGNGGDPLGQARYTPPRIIVGGVTQAMADVFDAAQKRMPLGFRSFLCKNIKYIVVDPNNAAPQAYAFWETKKQFHLILNNTDPDHDKPWSFIGIKSDNFTLPTQFDDYERLNADALTKKSLKFTSLQADSKSTDESTTLLALLAHEAGHIIWHRFQNRHDTACQTTSSSTVDFSDLTWQLHSDLPDPFHQFGQPVGHNKHLYDDPFPADLQSMTDARAAALLKKLYETNSNFVSLLAAVAPDEDFAETYKYNILLRANPVQIDRISIQYPGPSNDVLITSHFQTGNNSIKHICATKKEHDDQDDYGG